MPNFLCGFSMIYNSSLKLGLIVDLPPLSKHQSQAKLKPIDIA